MEQINPLISVIVPNYNHVNYLIERLESVFNQTYPNFEVIVLDDCSTDDSREILLEYANNKKVTHCIFNKKNSGNTFSQWNKGIALAKGEYIWIAETDDFCELNLLETLIKPMILDSKVVLTYCQSNKVNAESEVTGSWLDYTNDLETKTFQQYFIAEGNAFIEQFLIFKNVIPNASAVLFKKERALEIGSLDIIPSLKYDGDWMFYLNLIANKKIVFIPNPLNNFRYHSQSVIALAGSKKTVIELINIILNIRTKINQTIRRESPQNGETLLKINNTESKKIIYQKAQYYIQNKHKFKGYLLMFRVFSKSIIIKKVQHKVKTLGENRIKSMFGK